MTSDTDLRFAILIDADNVSEKYVHIVLDEVSNVGVATYKRIYGDWTSTRMTSWKSCLLDNSITPMQQYSYTFGKNATDSAMIIDAMDILYSGTVDGFAIVSSDSDFTRLASRLRESGMVVLGMGEQKTPKPFIAACNQFKYLDLLLAAQKQDEVDDDDDASEDDVPNRTRSRRRKSRKTREQTGGAGANSDGCVGAEPTGDAEQGVQTEPESGAPTTSARRRPGDRGAAARDAERAPELSEQSAGEPADTDGDEDAIFEEEVAFGEMSRADKRRHLKAIRGSIEAIIDTFSDEDGWVSLGQLGDQLAKRLPDFDVRNYGYKRLRPFLKSLGVYEFDEPAGQSDKRQIYLRIREE